MANSTIREKDRSRAFTLVEILIVMVISSVLVLGLNAAYRQARVIWSKTEKGRPIYHQVRLISETIRTELSCLYLPPAPDADPEGNEGSKPFKPLSIEASQLAFFTLTPSWNTHLAASRPARVTYAWTDDQDTGRPVLWRFEQPYSGQVPIAAETREVIADGLSDFKVEGIDENEPDYGASNSPPKAVRITLTWPDDDDSDRLVFQTKILIPAQSPLAP